MSYGWLTESSLLPKKAVKIGGVSDSSLYTLSSQIFSLQQEQQQKPLEFLSGLKSQRVVCPPGSQEREGECVERAARQAETEASEHSKLRGPEGGLESEGGQEVGRARRRRRGSHDSGSEEESGCVRGNAYPGSVRRWGRPSKKPLHWQARLMEAKNPRVEERAAADAQFVAAHAKTLEASRRKLEEKAKLYDDVISGRKDASEAPACARQLIDFEDKLCRAPPISLRTGSDSHSEPLSSEPQESLLFGAASARFTYEGEERRMSGEEGEAVSYERQSATTGEKTSWHAGWRDGVPDEPMETSGHSGDEQQSWRQRGRDCETSTRNCLRPFGSLLNFQAGKMITKGGRRDVRMVDSVDKTWMQPYASAVASVSRREGTREKRLSFSGLGWLLDRNMHAQQHNSDGNTLSRQLVVIDLPQPRTHLHSTITSRRRRWERFVEFFVDGTIFGQRVGLCSS
ncbi:hypothetical protein TGARI_209630 [Toxoplasma gondii ARI]|uniref:Uncharacterized protein n=1 Tax=Toxoplasma gondii ARI TaxID=1074872 RepID=A0A139XR60_TOXGO|nr:hypothetical protein TGARI_209630 [Toxoplasma gondii ARI]